MKNLADLNHMIDLASKNLGSDKKLAEAIGESPQRISNWRHGVASCTPENQTILAHLAGLDPAQVLARAMVQKWEGTSKGDKLYRALGKLMPATGAVLGSGGAIAMESYSTTVKSAWYFIRCILLSNHKGNLGTT